MKDQIQALVLIGVLVGGGCGEPPSSGTPTPEEGDDTPTPVEPTEGMETMTPTPSPTSTPFPSPTPMETATPTPDSLVSLKALPESMTIDTQSSFSLSLTATYSLSGDVVVDAEGWISSDEEVVEVDDMGVVTPVGEGIADVRALFEGVESEAARVEVIAPGHVEIQVVDADSAAPVAGAAVYLGVEASEPFMTDEQGYVSIDGDFSGPLIATAVQEDYHLATLQHFVSRTVTIPVRSWNSTLEGTFSGDSDFSRMEDMNINDVRIGIITRSFLDNPLALDTSTVIGPNREISLCGATLDIPSNIVGEAYCSSDEELDVLKHFSVPGPSGVYGTFMIAGDVNFDTVWTWVEGGDDVFTNIGFLLDQVPNIYDFSYYLGSNVSIAAFEDNDGVEAAPSGQLDASMAIEIPSAPSGIDLDYLPVAFAIADLGGSEYLPVGIDAGDYGSTIALYYAPEFADSKVYGVILAGEYGVGNEGAYVAVMDEVTSPGTLVEPPPFLSLLQPNSLESDVNTRTFAYYGIQDVSLYRSVFSWRVYLEDGDGDPDTNIREWAYWDVYTPPSDLVIELPDVPSSLALYDTGEEGYRVNWEIFGYDCGNLSFDIFTSTDQSVYDSIVELKRMSRNKLYHIEDGI